MPTALTGQILSALPQTQCTRCGYPDCAGYAQAVATGLAPINQCPPGGAQGIARLARITGQPITPLNPDFGVESPRSVAVIDENWCIGCTLCLPVCPTDAIVGGNKMMHTVIERYCTGCALCLPVCPVDCITLDTVTGSATGWDAWSQDQADTAKDRYAHHCLTRPTSQDSNPEQAEEEPHEPQVSIIQAALARARQQRSGG